MALMQRGGLGTRSLNARLQVALNGKAEPKITRFGWTFSPGDKVIQNVNDYGKEVFNGDIGFIEEISVEEGSAVVIPVAMQHYMLLRRNLLYTGVTRGRSLVVIIGEASALGMAVHSQRDVGRVTNFVGRLG